MDLNWKNELLDIADPRKALILSRFFKTAPGEYGEGDSFIGINVPANRSISKCYAFTSFNNIKEMLDSSVHEFRLAGLLALVERYKKSKRNPSEQKKTVDFYLENMHRCNNWDLVDLSAPYILGAFLLNNPNEELLIRLSHSPTLWIQRIAIVSTLTLIRNGKYETTLKIAESYLNHPHELIHKATGWMLREVGKHCGKEPLIEFLDRNSSRMPRTMLRYSIEKFPPELYLHY